MSSAIGRPLSEDVELNKGEGGGHVKKLVTGIIALAVVAVVAYLVLGPQGMVTPLLGAAADAQPTTGQVLPPVQDDPRVLAEAKVVPVREASLSLPTAGIVAEIMVHEGESVQAGQVLLRLADSRQRAGVAQTEAALRAAQARLDELRQGPRVQEIESARAAVDAAEARLNGLLEGPSQAEVAIAEANLASAHAALRKVLQGPRQGELTAARAEMANTEAALRRIQAEYDRVGWRNDRAALSVSLELEQATNTHIPAKARYEALVAGPTEAEIGAAEAGVQGAEAELSRVNAPPRGSDVLAARAEIRGAGAQLELLRTGARPEQIAATQADVAAAEAVLEQAKVALEEAELRAPFAGTVASLNVKVGESVAPGSPVAHLADLSAWHIETEDLTEIDAVSVHQGGKVAITLDAIPGLELPGDVVRIKSVGESKHGDMTYTVIIRPSASDHRMRWNMTTMVAIESSEP